MAWALGVGPFPGRVPTRISSANSMTRDKRTVLHEPGFPSRKRSVWLAHPAGRLGQQTPQQALSERRLLLATVSRDALGSLIHSFGCF